jgi:hypothetical protein
VRVFEHRESGYNDDVQRWFHDLEITVPSIKLCGEDRKYTKLTLSLIAI